MAKTQADLTPAHLRDKKPVDWGALDPDITYLGKMITLPAEPEQMPTKAAIDALQRKLKDEQTVRTAHEDILAFPLEGAVAFIEAMKQVYGWAQPVPTPGFFGPTPPHMISVEIDLGKYIQIPWGSFKLPDVENNILLSVGTKNGQPILQVHGEVRKKELLVLQELAQRTRQILKESSIYRGKAIHLRTGGQRDDGLDLGTDPTFLDLTGADPKAIILNDDVAEQILTNIYAPVMYSERVRQAKIPLKRGVLLSGKYGVGKTLITRATASVCVQNAWTFITIDKPSALKDALLFAQRYQPAMVFVEDIDRALSERDDEANEILNTLDGILSKDVEVMVVLTTNHIEKITPAMLRPGRLDAVITIDPPDASSVKQLVQLYARNLLAEGETLEKIGEMLAGNIPAAIREVVERSKLSMIAHSHDKMMEQDLIVSAQGIQSHLKLLEVPSAPKPLTTRLGEAFAELIASGGLVDDGEVASADDLEAMNKNLSGGLRRLIKMMSTVEEAALVQTKQNTKQSEQVDAIHEVVVGA